MQAKAKIVKEGATNLKSNIKIKLIILEFDRATSSARNFILNTEYGRLAIIRPMLIKKYLSSQHSVIRDVSYLNDNSSTSYCYSIIKNKQDLLLFKPESHYGNAVTLFKSIRKKLNQEYFGTDKRPENPFRNCKTPDQIFNLSRTIKLNIKMKLARFGFILLRNGEVNILHKEGSILQNNSNIQSICREFIKRHEVILLENPCVFNSDQSKFAKYDYFLSSEIFEGIISANNYIQKGITVPALGERKVYTNYGVFNPTRQDYIQLFDSYLRENIRDLKLHTKNCTDLGCGTGILSLLMSQFELPRVFAIDNNDNAILATKANSQALGYFDNIKAVNLDLVSNYYQANSGIKNKEGDSKNSMIEDNYSNLLKDRNMDLNYDLIVCNPPWINASYVFSQTDLENAIYDPDHKFLKSAFNFAKHHLNRNNPNSRFVILFSDLGSILNVNQPDIVETLASEYKLAITVKKTRPGELKTSDGYDPLKNFKKESKVLLYELKRIS